MEEITLILIIIVLLIMVFGLIIALIFVSRVATRAVEYLETFDDYLLNKFLIDERDKQKDG